MLIYNFYTFYFILLWKAWGGGKCPHINFGYTSWPNFNIFGTFLYNGSCLISLQVNCDHQAERQKRDLVLGCMYHAHPFLAFIAIIFSTNYLGEIESIDLSPKLTNEIWRIIVYIPCIVQKIGTKLVSPECPRSVFSLRGW